MGDVIKVTDFNLNEPLKKSHRNEGSNRAASENSSTKLSDMDFSNISFHTSMKAQPPTWTFGEDDVPLLPRTGGDAVLTVLNFRWTWRIYEINKWNCSSASWLIRVQLMYSCEITFSGNLLGSWFCWLTFLWLLKHKQKSGDVLTGYAIPSLHLIHTQFATFLCLIHWNCSFHNIAPYFDIIYIRQK